MNNLEPLKEHLQTIINSIKDTLNILNVEKVANPETLLINSTLNLNVNTFSLNPQENDLLNLLTEKIQSILSDVLPSIDEKSRKYLLDKLHEYHYDGDERKFSNPLTMNNLLVFLNDLESTQASLNAFQAAWEGNVFPVGEFIKNYPQFKDKPGIWGTTLLYSAARNNHMQLVDHLIKTARCSINAQNQQHIEKILTGSPVKASDFTNDPSAGSTALHGACYYGHLDIVKYLIENRADYYLTNHADESSITNAKESDVIEEYFRKFLILGYSIVTNQLPEKPIIEGARDLVDDCVWEYKPFVDNQWYPFASPEAKELSQYLIVPPDQQFQQEIHLKVHRGVYAVSIVKFLRSGKGLDHNQNLAWIRCRGSSISNFDCYSIWQIMIIQHPPIESNSSPSLVPFDFPSLCDTKFKLQGNSWYNCPIKINSKLDKAINYRRKHLSLNFPFIGKLKLNLQTFAFTNRENTVSGCLRWIPKLISIHEQNADKITYLDNFKPMTAVNPILMTSKHLKQTVNKDDNSLAGAGEHEMTDDVNDDSFYSSNDDLDNYDENVTKSKKTTIESIKSGAWSMDDVLNKSDSTDEKINNTSMNLPNYQQSTSSSTHTTTDIEPEIKIEDFVNETNEAAVQAGSPQTTPVDDLTKEKLQEATAKIDKLQDENECLMAEIQVQMMMEEKKSTEHERELEKLFQKMEKGQSERQKLEDEVKRFRQEQNRSQQIKTEIRTINYEKIQSQLVDSYLSPNHNLLLNYLKNVSTKANPQSTDYPPQVIFEKKQTMYTITVTGFQYHHDQFKIILQRVQSINNSIQSAKDYYQRHLNRFIRSLMITFSKVQSTTRYWLLYKNIFSNNLKEKIKEYVIMFNTFIEEQTKKLIEQCISNNLTRPWIEIRKFTNQFIENNPFINQIEQIKHKTLEQFIKENISFQRIKTDKKPTEKSASTAQEMIEKIIHIFQTNQEYRGHQLKQLQLIPPLLQRIIIYYCCFALQLPLFESAKDLLDKIEKNTIITITTSTGSGKSTLLPALLIAEGYDRVIVTQPRRLPCQLISRRVNETMTIDTNIKKEKIAGWIVSGAENNPGGKILYMTDGYLRERLLYDDSIIPTNIPVKKSIVIFVDEFHERSINIDLCLAFLARLLINNPVLKSKLKIIVSSATLDESVPNLFRNNSQIQLAEFAMPQMGTLYPVTKFSRPNANILDIVQELYKKCQRNDQILCFVNSALEATENCKLLSDISGGTINARPLIQSQSAKVQQENIEQASVLFSTTIAETSLTFPSLKYVIDTGYINIPIYNHELKRTILTTVRAAHSTIKQRSGRVGRTQSGEYYALYDFKVEDHPYPIPHTCLSDLTNIEFSLRRSPLKCGLHVIQRFLPDKPSPQSINYTIDALRTLDILEAAPSDEFAKLGKALAKIPDFGSLQMSISVLAALRHYSCGHDLICLASMLGVLNSTAIFSLIPPTFKSPDGDFMTLLNIMNKVLLVKQSIPSHQFNIDRICEAADLTKIRHIIGPALRRYLSLEKSFNLSSDYRAAAHTKSGKWEYIAKALLTGYSDNVFVSMRELQEKNLLFARYKDLNDIAVLDLKSTLTRPLKQEPVPLILVRDVLYSTAVRSRAIVSFAGEIKLEWMEYSLQRELILSNEEEIHLNSENRYAKARSLYSDTIHMQLKNKTLSLRGRSGTVLNAELHLRKEMITEIKFNLTNRHPPDTTLHQNLSRNLEQVCKMPYIFHPMIWRWDAEKQVKIKVNNGVSSKTCEITVTGRYSEIVKVKEEFDSFLSWLENCAVIRNPDADVPPRVLRPPMRSQCLDIEERISRITDSKRTRIDLYNAARGINATRESRMEVVSWIAVCKFDCKIEGGFVRDWVVGKYSEHPVQLLTNPAAWVHYQGPDQIPYMVKEVVPSDLDCHLPKRSYFDIEKFKDELHKYGIKCDVYRQAWRYILLIDKDEKTGPYTMDLIEPHVALTHDRIDLDVSNLYLEKDYTRELGMRVDIQQKPCSIELESIIDNIKKKRFRVLRSVDNILRQRISKMVDTRKWTQLGEPVPFIPSPDSKYISVLVPLPTSSVLYKDLSIRIATNGSGIQVKSIEQIRNPLLEDAYEAMKSLIARECTGSNPNERELFHGTKPNAVQGVTDYGFDDRYFSANGRWGHGAYFADNPQKSHGYTDVDPNDQTRVIFYAKVLLGIPSVQNTDNSQLRSAPIGFHSVQGTGGQYEEYIVYRYGQALPYLKITYK
ncbi:unnamed protein product [Rotaria sp. Silwood2]|nr:unnamed protein product [Rotaria sp. Silwood2]CAF3981646.1 unnamed protein product [Rotaria sp. Silwood2]